MRPWVPIAAGLNVIAGVWLLISPFILNYQMNLRAAGLAIGLGLIVAVLSGVRLVGFAHVVWLSWLTGGVGVVLAALAIGMDVAPAEGMVNMVVTGCVIVGLSVLGAAAPAPEAPRGAHHGAGYDLH